MAKPEQGRKGGMEEARVVFEVPGKEDLKNPPSLSSFLELLGQHDFSSSVFELPLPYSSSLPERSLPPAILQERENPPATPNSCSVSSSSTDALHDGDHAKSEENSEFDQKPMSIPKQKSVLPNF